jgi:chemotaxis protein MotB
VSKKKHPEHVNHERWLVSYADFITLLFAFFVVLFASSQSDKKKQIQLAAAMQSAFTPMGVFDAHSRTPPLVPGAGASASSNLAPIQPPLPTAEQIAEVEAKVQDDIIKIIKEKQTLSHLPNGSITFRTTGEGLVISLHEAGFFASGSAEVRPSSIPLIQQIATSLPPGSVRIEGHTDIVPIHTAQFASNWELSTTRAARIARLFLDRRVLDRRDARPADISAAGYAEFHPIASNATEAGRAQNRRIDIVILRPATLPAPAVHLLVGVTTPPRLPAPSR